MNVEPGNEVEDGHSQVMGGVIARGGGITVAVIAPLIEKSFLIFSCKLYQILKLTEKLETPCLGDSF